MNGAVTLTIVGDYFASDSTVAVGSGSCALIKDSANTIIGGNEAAPTKLKCTAPALTTPGNNDVVVSVNSVPGTAKGVAVYNKPTVTKVEVVGRTAWSSGNNANIWVSPGCGGPACPSSNFNIQSQPCLHISS